MDRFDALPTPQKVMVVFIIMALVAGGFYFLLITDAQARITAAKGQLRRTEQKAQQLKKFENPQLLKDANNEYKDLQDQVQANRALLPKEEKIPSLITSIKRQADERGLEIIRFEKGTREHEDYVDSIPVKMEVQGSFPVVVSFFDALAQPGMRLMTLSDIDLTAVSLKRLMAPKPELNPSTGVPQMVSPVSGVVQKANRRGRRTPLEQYIHKLDEYQVAVDQMQINARFTVNAYTYTGKTLTPQERAKRARVRHRHRARH